MNNEVDSDQIDVLKKELERTRRIANTSFIVAVLALAICGISCVNDVNPSRFSGTPQVSSETSQSHAETANFNDLTTKSIQIIGSDGKPAATFDASGITLPSPFEAIEIGGANSSLRIDSFGITENDNYGGVSSTTNVSSGSIKLTSNNPEIGSASTSVSPGMMDIDTSQNYTLTMGPIFESHGTTAGLFVFNDHYDKDHANGGAIDQSSATFSPDDISLVDNSGVERASIGHTDLTFSASGTNETTGLSSIVLFDSTGHVSWQSQ